MIAPERIRTIIAAALGQPIECLPDSLPIGDAVPDSYAWVELVIGLQEEAGVQIGGEDMKTVVTVGDLIEVFARDLHDVAGGSGND